MYISAHLFVLLESGGNTCLAYCNITYFTVHNAIIFIQYNINMPSTGNVTMCYLRLKAVQFKRV
jgi:hypothetical protein